jgi:hypothetical protein
MGFDNNDGQPLIHLRRWGTKVIFAMVLGIIAFLALGFVAIRLKQTHANKIATGAPPGMADKR